MNAAEVRFERPYYVTRHAVERFRELVEDLPPRAAIAAIQQALQVIRPVQAAWERGRLDRVVAECEWRGRRYWAVIYRPERGHGDWPVVVTVTRPEWRRYHGCRPPWAPGRARHLARRRVGRPWTLDEWRQLVSLRRKGLTWREIAAILGRSPLACRVAWSRYRGRRQSA